MAERVSSSLGAMRIVLSKREEICGFFLTHYTKVCTTMDLFVLLEIIKRTKISSHGIIGQNKM